MDFDVGSSIDQVQFDTGSRNVHNWVGLFLPFLFIKVDALCHQIIMPEIKYDFNQLTGQSFTIFYKFHA